MHPFIVRKVIFPLHERLKGKATYRHCKELERTQWLSSDELEELQLEKLRSHLAFAYSYVPYYRQLFDAHGLQPGGIQTLKEFAGVPYLTRDIIRNRFEDLKAQGWSGSAQVMSTGGSTGSPVSVLVDSDRAAFTDAARLRAHRWYGVDIGAREIVLWGSPIELGRQDFIRSARDWLINSRLLSAFDLGATALTRYAHFIQSYRPTKIYGYASAVYLLASHMKREGWKANYGWPAVVFATAEPLFDFQRSVIESVFACPVAVEYGARDAGLMANQCPHGGLHVPCEGMVVEIDGPNGEGLGEIVVTNLYSKAMPIIRYRTGDLGEIDPTPCPCGRGLPRLKRVEGRRTDFIIAPDGRVLHALAVIYILREIPGLKEFRVVQESITQITAQVVFEDGSPQQRCDFISSSLRRLLGNEVEVKVEVVAALPRVASGKFRYVISKVADQHLRSVVTN